MYNVRFQIVGDGRFKSKLQDLINKQDINSYFELKEKVQPEKIPKLVKKCDAALIILGKNNAFSNTIPSKTQSLLAMGIPIIVSANGEVNDIIMNSKSGLTSNAGDVEGLVSNIIEMLSYKNDYLKKMGLNGRIYYKNNFDKKFLMDKMDKWIKKILYKEK